LIRRNLLDVNALVALTSIEHPQYPKAQGLRWTCRQDDRSQAVVLFGTRVQASDVVPAGGATPLIENGAVYDLAKTLATDLGVLLD